MSALSRLLKLRPGEAPPVVLAFSAFFCVLVCYYIVRPLRDEMGIRGGVRQLQWVFTATFGVMLVAVPAFGLAARRIARSGLVLWTYYFFLLNLILFYMLFRADVAPAWVARAFFVWVSVFNMFVVSLFWSVMVDCFEAATAKRVFGLVAAGGSAGAVTGPALTAGLSRLIGPEQLLLLSAGFLIAAAFLVRALLRVAPAQAAAEVGGAPAGSRAAQGRSDGGDSSQPIGGGIFAGALRVFQSSYLAGISGFMLLFTTLSTFLYFEQAYIVEKWVRTSAQRTELFALIDLVVNVLTILLQLFVTARLMERLGVAVVLTLVPLFVALGFAALGFWPLLGTLVVFQTVKRAGDYAVSRPAREVLYTGLTYEDKYKSKNFIDTVVYRGGDAASAWAFTGLKALGMTLATLPLVAAPLAIAWAAVGYALGKRHASGIVEAERD